MKINEIYLGDAYELIKSVPDKSVDLVVCDPPYEIVAGGGGGAFGVENRNYHEEVSKKLNYGINNSILVELERVMKRTNIYIFCNKNQLLQYFEFYKDKNVDLLVWHKTNPIPMINQKYLSDLEYIIFARDKKGVLMYNTYETSSKLFQTTTNKDDKDLYEHPTIKPESIIENLIINSSQEGQVVFDPFLGSGTTAAVAKRLGRQYLGFEIEEKWFSIAQDRLKGLTKEDRNLKEKGQQSIFDLLNEI
jgi:DNA modification methylase